LFGSTHLYATATNKDGTEIKNCEFKFDTEWFASEINNNNNL